MPAAWRGTLNLTSGDVAWPDPTDDGREIFFTPDSDPSEFSSDITWTGHGLQGGSVDIRTYIGRPPVDDTGERSDVDLVQQFSARPNDQPGTVFLSYDRFVAPYSKYTGQDFKLWPLFGEEFVAVPTDCEWTNLRFQGFLLPNAIACPGGTLPPGTPNWFFDNLPIETAVDSAGWTFNGVRWEYVTETRITEGLEASVLFSNPVQPFTVSQVYILSRRFWPEIVGLPSAQLTFSMLTECQQYLTTTLSTQSCLSNWEPLFERYGNRSLLIILRTGPFP